MNSKIIKNIAMIVLFVMVFVGINNLEATSYSISSTNLTVGSTATVSINGTGYAGKYTISTSNATVASINNTSLFIDNQVASVIVTAKAEGAAVITVTPTDVSSYDNPEESLTQGKSFTVNVKNPVVTNTQTNNNTSNNTSQNTTQQTTTKSSNANLRTLVPEVEGLTPSFNPNTTHYTLTVPSTITNLKMSVAVEQSGAKYWIEGDENLQLGNNTVTVTVTAPSGAKKTYTIIVTKAEDATKANALLTSLVIEGHEFSPEFSAEVFDYDIGKVESDVEKLNILTFTESDKANVEIQGNETLLEGENLIKIIVTAEDGTTRKEYNIKYNKEAKLVAEDETNALETMNEVEVTSLAEEDTAVSSQFGKAIKDNALLLLMYLVVLVEFVQIIYLYRELRKRDSKIEEVEENFDKYNINIDDIEEITTEEVAEELTDEKEEIASILNEEVSVEENLANTEEHISKDFLESNELNNNLEEKITEETEITSKIKTIWDDEKPDFSEELNNVSDEEKSSRVRGGRKK